jgi:hypothetical protein
VSRLTHCDRLRLSVRWVYHYHSGRITVPFFAGATADDSSEQQCPDANSNGFTCAYAAALFMTFVMPASAVIAVCKSRGSN